MGSSWIARKDTKGGEPRYRVMYRTGGREQSPQYGGTFKTMRSARLRQDVIDVQIGSRGAVFAPNVCVIEWVGIRVGRVWRLKYRDADGRQVMAPLGRERDGYTREQAEDVAARFLLGQQANPLNALVRLCETLVARQERDLGEALPHLYVAQVQLRELHRLAVAEIASKPDIFDEAVAA